MAIGAIRRRRGRAGEAAGGLEEGKLRHEPRVVVVVGVVVCVRKNIFSKRSSLSRLEVVSLLSWSQVPELS